MTDQAADNATAGEAEAAARPGHAVGIWAIILLGLGYGALHWLSGDRAWASVLWWLDPLLLLGFAAGWWARSRRPGWWPRLRLSGVAAAVVFIGGSWLAGMLYELSLRTGPTGFGGMHPDTATSFVLAQGHYLPFAVGGWWLARRYGYGAAGVFWTGALASLYEMVIAGFPAIAGAPQFWLLTPLILGYYLYVYALILAFPLLFLDERSLWAAAPRSIGAWGKVWRGVLFGLLYWVVFVGWAGLIGV
jgi:hypothetical protein